MMSHNFRMMFSELSTYLTGCYVSFRIFTLFFGEFDNEMIFQTMRHKVYLETADIRKIMVARAMASTIIDDEEPKPQTTDFNADEILTDWFENNENN